MKKIKWGIMATGRIAATFADALNFVEDAELYACASRDLSRAKAFAEKFGVEKYYDSYEEMADDENLDVIYVASPMAQHYEQTKMCLLKGKNVLCEKTVTLNNKQLSELIKIAESKNVFFMEAMWMKFLPAFIKAKEWVEAGRIGIPKMIKCDFSNLCPFNAEDRLFNKSLGGGCLLDLGVYPITFACEFLGYEPQEIISNAYIGKSGVDFDASIILKYKDGFAHLTAGFDMENENPAFIIGDKGRIRFKEWFFCTDEVALYDDEGNLRETFKNPHLKNGYEYEIMEVHFCLRQGKKQSNINSLYHTTATMKIMDECRNQWGLKFDVE
ncbi:MAG: Gfo/Idh/MocA family oxidoreductase [Ruminiclostridium sp.]|nr:Gfo/Idh/MocA family oxidoreductase [Ruminiclostridium sp.]